MKNVSERERRENHRHPQDNVDRRDVNVDTEGPSFSLEVERRRARRGQNVGDGTVIAMYSLTCGIGEDTRCGKKKKKLVMKGKR